MFGGNKNDKMHPDDIRNLILFFVIAGIFYMAYDAYILKPHAAALRQQKAAQVEMIKNQPVAAADTVPLTRTEALTGNPRVEISNGKISGTIALVGARIDDIALEDYFETIDKKEKVTVLSPKGTLFPRHVSHGWISEEKLTLPDDNSLWRVQGNNKLSHENPVTLVWENGQGLRFENIYTIDEGYMIHLVQKVTNNTGAKVELHPYGLVSQIGLPPQYTPLWVVHEGPVGYMGEELHQIAYGKFRKLPAQMESYTGTNGWAGITDKYWLTSLIPPQDQELRYTYRYTGAPPAKRQKDMGRYQVDYTAAAVSLAPGESASVQSHVFAGAKKVLMLENYEHELNIPNLDLAVDFGWFWFMSKPFFFALHYMAELTNIAIAMILLTIMIRMAVFPLTNVSYKSFAKMKKVSPQVVELRRLYGGDKARLQSELVKLYEREGVNPMSGCLPILIQIPIFFSLYKVFVNTIEMRHAPFFGWVKDMSAPDPTNIFTLFGLIDWNPPSFIHEVGIWPCLLLVCFLIQKRLNPPPQDPIQRDMANYFPFLMAYLMSGFAAGLVIYWTLSAVIGIMQQMYIMRSLGVPIYLFGESPAEKELDQAVKEGPAGVHPLVAMAEKDAEESLFGDDENPVPPPTISPPKPRKKKKK